MARVVVEYPGNTIYSQDISVRISDVNVAGHLGFDALASYLNEVRVRFFSAFGLTSEALGGSVVVFADLAIVYQSEAFHGEVLRIDVAIGDVEAKGCDLVYRITKKGSWKPVALAKSGIVFINSKSRKASDIPPEFLEIIESGTL